MKLNLPKMKSRHLAALILLAAIFVRFWKMEYIPYQSDGDELGYVFAGMSLVQENTPISWSGFGGYSNWHRLEQKHLGREDLKADGNFDFVIPWFDHPFLLPLLEGAWASLLGYEFLVIPPSLILRLPMLLTAAATLWLTYIITKKLYGDKAGLLSLLVMGFSPSFVFIHRMVVGENLYMPIILTAVWLLINDKHTLWLLISLSLLAGFSKMTGLIIVPLIVTFFLIQKQYKKALIYFFITTILFAIIYALYGALLDWELFVTIFKTQSYRFIGWSNPAFILSHPGFATTIFLDMSYYLILLLGLTPFFVPNQNHQKNDTFLFLAVLITFFLVWLTSAEQDALGWYKLPLFTFLVISMGRVVQSIESESFIAILVTTVANNYGLVRFPTHPLPSTDTLRLAVGMPILVLFIIILFPIAKATTIKKILISLLLVLYLGEAFYIADKYYEASCKDRVCPVPELTTRQLITNLIQYPK